MIITTERPLHICFTSLQARGAFSPDVGGKIGGAENQVRLLAQWLAAHGQDVSVIVEDSGQPELEIVHGVQLRRLVQPAPRRSIIGRVRRQAGSATALWRLARELAADVYIQRTAGVETGLVAHAAVSLQRPFIFIASSDAETGEEWRRGRTPSALLFRDGLRRATRVLVQHEDQRKAYEAAYGRPAQVFPDVYPFPAEIGADGERILWIGRCVEVKRPELFLELARRLPSRRFVMVAPPSEHGASLAKRIARDAAAIPNLDFIPGLPHDLLGEMYRNAGVLVNTSRSEGLPNTFFEAAAHGLAIVSLAADAGGLLTHEAAGLCAGDDFEELVKLVEGLLTAPTRRRKLSAHAFAILRARHDIETVGPAFIDLLRELTSSAVAKQ